jgi:hypothetical protein
MSHLTGKETLALAGLVLLASLACDPFPQANTADPKVNRALAISSAFSQLPPVLVEAPDATGAWVIPGTVCPSAQRIWDSACGGNANQNTVGRQIIAVTSNQLFDASTVQAAPEDCTPVNIQVKENGAVLTPGSQIKACYSPSSTVEGDGASILVFKPNADPSIANDPGQAASLLFNATYEVQTVNGGLIDHDGKKLDFKVVLHTQAAPDNDYAADGFCPLFPDPAQDPNPCPCDPNNAAKCPHGP